MLVVKIEFLNPEQARRAADNLANPLNLLAKQPDPASANAYATLRRIINTITNHVREHDAAAAIQSIRDHSPTVRERRRFH